MPWQQNHVASTTLAKPGCSESYWTMHALRQCSAQSHVRSNPLHYLSAVSAVSCFTISATVFICMVQLIVYGDAAARGDDGSGDDDGGHADWSGVAFNTDAGILTWSGAVNSVIFRYAPSNLVV